MTLRQLDDLQAPSVAPKLERCEPQDDSTDSNVRASSNCGALTLRRVDLLVGLVAFQQQPVAHPGAVLKVPVIAAGLDFSTGSCGSAQSGRLVIVCGRKPEDHTAITGAQATQKTRLNWEMV